MDTTQLVLDGVLFLVYSFGVIVLLAYLIRFWKLYVNTKHINNIAGDWVMLEIKLPRDINKSPVAMEIAANAFLQGGGISQWYVREIKGALPAQFSLEIASLEGTIHFYIRTLKKFKPLIEANVYSQFPGVEIVEADDYTKLIRYEHLSEDKVKMWGARYKLGKEWEPSPGEKLPADFVSLKTYVDYGLDKDPKEEYKNDPLTPLLEFFGSLGKGEYAWYQVIVQDSENIFNGKKFPKSYVDPKTHKRINLAEMAAMRKAQIRRGKTVKAGDIVYNEYGNPIQRTVPDGDGKVKFEPLTYGEEFGKEGKQIFIDDNKLNAEEKGEIENINRKLQKPLVRVIVRLMYLAKTPYYSSAHVQNILSILKPFNAPTYNYLTLTPTDPYNFPWEDTLKRRVPWRTEEMFHEYVEREGFFAHIPERDSLDQVEDVFFFPYPWPTRRLWRLLYETIFHPFYHPESKDFCTMNLEELVTLYHFPGQVAATPTLPRIDSTKAVPPVNLPQ